MATKTKVVIHRIQRDSSNNLVLDDGGSPACKPKHYVLIVVINDDTSSHTVVLDPTDIRFKSSNTLPKKNPTRQSAKGTLTLEPGEGDVIKLHVRADGDFDGSDPKKLPYGDYKYTLEVDGGVPDPSFDPGFNITPP